MYVAHIAVHCIFIQICTAQRWFAYESKYEGWNFNIGNYLFTTDTK